ncbi:MmcQ/YjbR family DNA-binding protein [Paenibacillus beijingensis]|uniref:Phosphoribosylglycinamide formyltransferase n=1 Tax=Paenibacillus beijingensis TaxID=1126833 RepID=A0A0D5NS74_9BACL|nr:MmcQ/YjbR family DNA-binding protein [Paenibacillus beijingensis]AJY77852.1 phosphoribosylglycinamide formyltransferase [Paenibacillus beijingensis]
MEHDNRIKSEQGLCMLEQVRLICGSLPETEEIIDGFGHTTFKVKGKSFIIMGENEDGPGLSFKSDRENQEFLLLQGRFVKTPYIGHHGWVSTRKDVPFDWAELGELLKEAYLRAAPKRLVKELRPEADFDR